MLEKAGFKSLLFVKNLSGLQVHRQSLNLSKSLNVSLNSRRFCQTAGATEVESEQRLKFLQSEMARRRQADQRAPDPARLNESQWEHLLGLKSQRSRFKYHEFLWKIEKTQKNKADKKARLELERPPKEEQTPESHISYGLGKNTFFMKVYPKTISTWQNNNLLRAMQFGQKVVLDCSYEKYMAKRERNNTAKQILELFVENKRTPDPFDIHFCNVDFQGDSFKALRKYNPRIEEPCYPMNLHSESFLSLFPREKLVYLTPHCQEDLESFNHDDVYIVGAFVDKVNKEPISLAKARSQGLRMARLPLDKYLRLSPGSSKSLTLDQMIKILQELKSSGDWNEALKHVPVRKLEKVQ